MFTKYFVPTNSEKTTITAKVHKILESHVGAQHPITGKQIAQVLFMEDDRKIRVIIADLIHAGVPVGSSVGNPAGYFLVTTGDEAAQVIKVLKSRISEDEQRLRDFEKATENIAVPQQGGLL
jgi:hypothetical protein